MKKFLMWLLLASCTAQAEVYKCQNPDGGVKFQKNPCMDNPDARPMELKQPSPETRKRMDQEALRQRIAEEKRREETRKEEKHQAELYAIYAREQAWNALNYDIQRSREEADARHEAWEAERECRERRKRHPHTKC